MVRLGVGIIVVPASVTAVEAGGPITSPDLEWMYWHVSLLSGGAQIGDVSGFVRFDVDVKAMRKIHKSNVHVIVENKADADGHLIISASLSFLFQE